MLKQLFAATAFAALISGASLNVSTAQETPAPSQPVQVAPEPIAPTARADGFLVSNIVGEGVYNSSADDAETIGKVTDIVLDKDGKIDSLIVGVGGFLGVGQKDVKVAYSQTQWAEKNGDRWLVASMSKEDMQAAPAFDPAPYRPVATMPTASVPEAPVTTPTQPKLEPATPPSDPATPAPAQ